MEMDCKLEEYEYLSDFNCAGCNPIIIVFWRLVLNLPGAVSCAAFIGDKIDFKMTIIQNDF